MKKLITGIAAGFANGLFGSGGGTLLVPALQKFFKMETHKSHATALAVVLPLSALSALIYVKGDKVDWHLLLWVTIGGVAGGAVGAKLLSKLSARWLHYAFGGILLFAAVRMIFC